MEKEKDIFESKETLDAAINFAKEVIQIQNKKEPLTKDDLEKLREHHRQQERFSAKLQARFDRERSEKLDKLVWSDILLQEQKNTDILILQEELFKWHTKAKNAGQKELLITLIKCVWRVDAYYKNVDTALGKAIIELQETTRQHKYSMRSAAEYKSLNEKLVKQMQDLKNFYEEKG